MKILKVLFILLFIQSCASIQNKDNCFDHSFNIFLKPNPNNSASIEVIRKILHIERFITNYKPEEVGGFSGHLDDIESLSNIRFTPVGNWAGGSIPDTTIIKKWKKWYLENSQNFRYAYTNEFSKDTVKYFQVLDKEKSFKIHSMKRIVLENKKDSIYTYSKGPNFLN